MFLYWVGEVLFRNLKKTCFWLFVSVFSSSWILESAFQSPEITTLGFWVGPHWIYRSIYETGHLFEYLPNQDDSSGVALLIIPGCSSRSARETRSSVYRPFIHSQNNAHNSRPWCPARAVQDACTGAARLFKGWRQRHLSNSQPRFMGTTGRQSSFNAPGVETWCSSRHLPHCRDTDWQLFPFIQDTEGQERAHTGFKQRCWVQEMPQVIIF